MNYRTKQLTYSAVALAAAYLLPFITAGNTELGNMLCLMHIPVLLCGFICGPIWGGAVGLIAPLLRHFTLQMPPDFVAFPMAIELCAYGALTGLLYKLLPKKVYSVYISLTVSMLIGRFIWGLAKLAWLFFVNGVYKTQDFSAIKTFLLTGFWTNAFAVAVIGIAIQIVLIPLIIIALQKANLIPQKKPV